MARAILPFLDSGQAATVAGNVRQNRWDARNLPLFAKNPTAIKLEGMIGDTPVSEQEVTEINVPEVLTPYKQYHVSSRDFGDKQPRSWTSFSTNPGLIIVSDIMPVIVGQYQKGGKTLLVDYGFAPILSQYKEEQQVTLAAGLSTEIAVPTNSQTVYLTMSRLFYGFVDLMVLDDSGGSDDYRPVIRLLPPAGLNSFGVDFASLPVVRLSVLNLSANESECIVTWGHNIVVDVI